MYRVLFDWFLFVNSCSYLWCMMCLCGYVSFCVRFLWIEGSYFVRNLADVRTFMKRFGSHVVRNGVYFWINSMRIKSSWSKGGLLYWKKNCNDKNNNDDTEDVRVDEVLEGENRLTVYLFIRIHLTIFKYCRCRDIF